MSDGHRVAGHAFISYVRGDAQAADRLQRVLEAAGIRVWRDTGDLWPGQDWRATIRHAIIGDALAFIACFSRNSVGREKSYQNEELTLAIEQLRQRQPGDSWLIPVRLDDCVIPDWDIGGGRTLASIQQADLFGDNYAEGAARLVAAVLGILARRSERPSPDGIPSGFAAVGATSASETAVGNHYRETADMPGAAAASAAHTRGAGAVTPVNGQVEAGPAATSRWRLTHTTADATAMSQLGNQGFGHRAYMRPAEQAPPWVRIRAVVACNLLGETLRWQELRRKFDDLLAQESIRGLINELTGIPGNARWHPRATHRRSWLEADLTEADETAAPAASALLFLPESEITAGLQPGCTELTIHADFAPASVSSETEFPLSYWRARFAQALAVPGELASWLEHHLGLMTSNQPAAQFGIMLQARQSLTEIVNTNGIKKLPSSYTQNLFTGWAVADASGKTVPDLASEMTLDLSERMLHLDGTIEQMTGFA